MSPDLCRGSSLDAPRGCIRASSKIGARSFRGRQNSSVARCGKNSFGRAIDCKFDADRSVRRQDACGWRRLDAHPRNDHPADWAFRHRQEHASTGACGLSRRLSGRHGITRKNILAPSTNLSAEGDAQGCAHISDGPRRCARRFSAATARRCWTGASRRKAGGHS